MKKELQKVKRVNSLFLTNWKFNPTLFRFTFLLFGLMPLISSAQPTRNGAIDMSASEGLWFKVNPDNQYDICNNAFTVEMWVQLRSNTANDMCLFDFRSGGNQLSFTYINDTKFRLETNGALGSWYWDFTGFTQTTTFMNNWVHVALAYDGGSGVTLYINGVQKVGYGLLTNGQYITKLFPGGGNGACVFGGTSAKGIKGQAYISEARIWKTRVSGTYISKYYDEEVNKSHPDWSSLLNYYHGTKENISGSNIYMDDAVDRYDATIINSNVRVKDLYPPIKPPAFDNSTFNTTVTAGTCQSTTIPVSWTNLRSSAYTTGNDVYYELYRSDNTSSSKYSGNGSTSYSDASVSSGNAFTYSLKTSWLVNGVKYYSDDSKTSNTGSITTKYSAPSGFTATTNHCDNTIDLAWSWSTTDPPKWTVQRATNSAFTANVLTLSAAEAGSSRSYTNVSPGADTYYYYRVFASGTDANGCAVTGTSSTIVQGITSKPPSAPTNVTITQNTTLNRLEINWTNPAGNNATSFSVIRTDYDGTNQATYSIPLTTTHYYDTDVQICKTYIYKVATINGCSSSGVFATNTVNGNISQDLSKTIKTVTASKGYYSNSVRIEWEINGSLSTIDRFKIYRSLASENNYKLIKVVDNDLIFDDETAVGGTFYNYKIVGEALCNTTTVYSNEGIDMGFVIPFGVANGHVEYSGGNAVEDVSIQFSRSSGNSGKSIFLDGNGDYVESNSYLTSLCKADFTLEAWVKTTGGNNQSIFVKSDGDTQWEFGEKNMYLDDDGTLSFVGFSCNYIHSTKAVNDGQWHHVAIVWDYNTGTTGKGYAFVDGVDVTNRATTNFVANADDVTSNTIKIGMSNYNIGGEGKNFFTGNVDEVRIWSVARSANEIKQDYKRILNNSETGLVAYWRCDEGIGSKIYDASKTGIEFNKRDGSFMGDVKFSTTIPSASQLGIIGVTDKYGDYSIDYIPYTSGGETFKVTPSLGQHQFSPSSRSVYVGDGAQTHNGLDFTDISSFTVSGKVTYYNSEVPVEGVAVLIDGKQAIGIDNKPVRSGADGKYSINVPIGFHYLSTEKEGHIFSKGYFPALNAYGDIQTYEFSESITVNFVDSTKIKVAGRVVGGTREGDKEIGYGKSTNNIGVSEIRFKLQLEGYDLDIEDNNTYNEISVITDPYTGEYSIEMIPEMWVVEKAGNATYFLNPSDIPLLDLRNSLTLTTTYDSTKIINPTTHAVSYTVKTFNYHQQLNYIIRETPEIVVYNSDGSTFAGDTIIYFTDQVTKTTDTLLLGSKSPFSYPVFQMGKTYNSKIFIYEEYSNPNHPNGAVNDLVPVNGASLIVNNNLMINAAAVSGKTDTSGYYLHTFKAGVPNISKNGSSSYTKTFEVDASVAGKNISWRSGNLFRAYVLGELPMSGTDFVTYGPEVVEMVLRDPPGSNSYAYVEEGSVYSKSESWNIDINNTSSLDLNTKKGLFIGLGGGLAGPMVINETVMDSEYGIEIVKSFDYDGNYTTSYKFTQRISTSADPEDVGSSADLFIGRSYNAFMTKSKNLKVMNKQYCITNGLEYLDVANSSVVLGVIDGIVFSDDKSSTMFVYSQDHIINDLIPNLIKVRNSLLLSSKYKSHFTASSPYYGLNNDNESLDQFKTDSLAKNPSANLSNISYTFTPSSGSDIDSVEFINQQISLWINTLALNEAEKATATTLSNISIDGSAGAYKNEIEEKHNSSLNSTSRMSLKLTWNSAFGNTTNGAGFNLHSNWNIAAGLSQKNGTSEEHSVKFGYVIDERDAGDYYSIDVKNQEGVAIFSEDQFTEFMTDKKSFLTDRATELGIGVGTMVGKTGLTKLISSVAKVSTTKGNAIVAGVSFGIDLGLQLYGMYELGKNSLDVHDKIGNNTSLKISSFHISSPIFSIRGGQAKCPAEGEEYTSFYIDKNTKDIVKLNTATLQREVPVIDVEPAIVTNVPESGKASFTLKLQNQSESNTDNWYAITIDPASNPHGAVLLIDGLTAEKSFLVPAWKTLSKTLTIAKGKPEIMNYDSIAIILHSICQFDPTNSQVDIADTVYVSAHFTPECSAVNIKNLNDNWVINYADSNKVAVTLSGYDINSSTLNKVSFQYKTLSGTPITVKSFFKSDTTSEYRNYTGDKGKLTGSTASFIWDISSMTDRTYMLRSVSSCSDGSSNVSPYLTGVIDRVTPTVFGTPEPADGILEPADDISIQFNEVIESGLVNDNNISVKGILNGADVSHASSASFNGVNNYGEISSLSFNEKSFTIEFWLQRESGSKGTVFSKGGGNDKVEIAINDQQNINYTLGANSFIIDPSSFYSTVYPINSWHHWAFVYDKTNASAKVYMDDQVVFEQTKVNFDPGNIDNGYLAKSSAGTNYFNGKVHEFRIWEKALTNVESYATMSTTLSGQELGLYGYWPLDEGIGTLAIDKTAGRNMTLNASWSLVPGSYAFNFNGSDQYLTLNGQNVVVDNATDVTIEFWYKGSTPTQAVTLFSNGLGNGIEVYTDPSQAASIGADANGKINVYSNGKTFTAISKNTFDNNWHHFALVVNRKTNVKAYLDGELQNTASTNYFSGLAGSKMWIGARGKRVDPVTNSMDQYFNGSIDEFRIWNTSRAQAHIKLYKNAKLSGKEDGLIAYYPFETYKETMGTYIFQSSLADQINSDTWVNGSVAIAHNEDSFTTQGASMKDVRPVQDIPFEFVVNNDKIVITPTIDAYRIEGQIIEISVKNIQDLHGNRMLSPKSWIAYVQKNQVVWQESSLSLQKHKDTSLTFTAVISNLGGQSYEYQLENIPSWLSTNQETGVISPNSKVTVLFKVNSGVNTGTYEQGINLKTSLGFDEKLNVKLRVYETEPNWAVAAGKYQYSMNLIGRLTIDEVVSTDSYDKVAAFVNGECRGVANLKYVSSLDAYEVYLTIYSNVTTGENIELKVWDASAGKLHEDVTPEITFTANSIKGTPLSPIDIIADQTVARLTGLNKGWNWISFNFNSNNLSNTNSTLTGLGTNGDVIKGKNNFDSYSANSGWNGSLTSNGGLNPEEMYKLYVRNGGVLNITGTPVDVKSTVITIENGWNYIGYLPQVTMPVAEALVSLNPQDGDLIKGYSSFAMYSGNIGWIGSLENLTPGAGYMLYSNQSGQLIYPETGSLSAHKSSSATLNVPKEWKIEEGKYSTNMSIVAKIENSTLAGLNNNEILGAFIGGECRGYAKTYSTSDDSTLYFLTIFGELSSDIQFKLFDEQSTRITEVETVVTYSKDKVLGSISSPYPLKLSADGNSINSKLSAMPNPFTDKLNVQVFAESGSEVELILYNSLGEPVYSNKFISGGKDDVVIDCSSARGIILSPGTYVLKVKTPTTIEQKAVVKF